MNRKSHLRTSFAAKLAAVILLLACLTGTVAGVVVSAALSQGVGMGAAFEEDPLCESYMRDAASSALYYTIEDRGYFMTELESRYGGFSAEIYKGEPLPENLVGTWSRLPAPENTLAAYTYTLEARDENGEYALYTVVGSLSDNLPPNSVFQRNYIIYNILHTISYNKAVFLTLALLAASAVLLVYLLWAAGHRAGVEGVVLNWQDRIPLDIYILCASTVFVIVLSMVDRFLHWNQTTFYLPAYLVPLGLSVAAAEVVALAALLTLAARLKRGGWWRNTVCYFLASCCWRLWKRCWNALTDFVRILPLAWRTVLGAAGVLGAQFILTALVITSWDGFIFFLLLAAMDTALVVGAAWLTRQLQQVQDMGRALAAGDLEAKLDTRKMYWDVKGHAENLNAIGVGMNRAVEQRMRSEHLKTELITNVSHDIKTPLTSIVNYVDLLKKEELPPAAAEYVSVLDRQSRRLKKLTEDLVEASKASTGNISVSLDASVVNEIMHQAIGDYDEKLSAGRLEVILNTYEGNLMALADGRLLWRVLDNLLSNVCKYAMAGTRVYVDLGERSGRVFLSMKNISRDPLNVSVDELMERFVRGDASRHTEGSGLGLNIARSLMDLMGGTFELGVDGDLFKAELTLQAASIGGRADPLPPVNLML